MRGLCPRMFATLLLSLCMLWRSLDAATMQGALRSTALPKTLIEVAVQSGITSGVGHVGIFLAALIRIISAGLNLPSLAIVPNTYLVSSVVINWICGSTVGSLILPVGMAYGTDCRKVDTVQREIPKQHPIVWAILSEGNWPLSARSDINYTIAKRFSEKGIGISFLRRNAGLCYPQSLKQSGGL